MSGKQATRTVPEAQQTVLLEPFSPNRRRYHKPGETSLRSACGLVEEAQAMPLQTAEECGLTACERPECFGEEGTQ